MGRTSGHLGPGVGPSLTYHPSVLRRGPPYHPSVLRRGPPDTLESSHSRSRTEPAPTTPPRVPVSSPDFPLGAVFCVGVGSRTLKPE